VGERCGLDAFDLHPADIVEEYERVCWYDVGHSDYDMKGLGVISPMTGFWYTLKKKTFTYVTAAWAD
jgi:hypothetical protein